MFSKIIVFGALHTSFIVWYFGSLGVIGQWPITSIWSVVLLAYLSKNLVLRSSGGTNVVFIKDDWLFIALAFCVSAQIMVSLIFRGDQLDYNGVSLFRFNADVFYLMVMYYLLGRFCFDRVVNSVNLAAVGFFILFLCVILNVDYGLGRIRMDFLDERKMGLYLVLSDFFAVVSIVAFCSVRQNNFKILIAMLSAVALFYLNSRASLYVLLLVYIFYFSCLRLTSAIKYGTGFVVALIVVVFLFGGDAIESNERMGFILGRMSDDGSLLSRIDQFDLGFRHIIDNPFFGYYGGVVQDMGVVGAYIHNALSYWQQFGVLVFILFIVMLLKNYIFFVRLFIENKTLLSRPDCQFVLTGGLFSILMIAFARSYTWYFVWLYIGYASMVRHYLFVLPLKDDNSA